MPSQVKFISGNIAVAEAVKRIDIDVVSAYPITPQTHVVEYISQYIADGEMDASFIKVESEHSALSVCAGAAAVGSRTFTATSSQGLALMHEVLFAVSGCRLPIVMSVSNRALSAPLNIWCDHSDSMAQRDSGWIQLYCENAQEVFDTTIQAFRIAEHKNVYLPVMVNLDGFFLSHTYEKVLVEDKEAVQEFVPEFKPRFKLDPDFPSAIGAYAFPEYYAEFKRQQVEGMRCALRVIPRIGEEFGRKFGRSYGLIEEYRVEDAEIVLITMGSIAGAAKSVVDELRKQGKKVGHLKLRTFRPFPKKILQTALRNASIVGVLDRSVSFGAGGPVAIEVRAALDIPVLGFVAGLGGRDILVEELEQMFKLCEEALKKKQFFDCKFIGVRE